MKTNTIDWQGWETVRLIGRGSFGSVFEVQRTVGGTIEKAAIKKISIPQNEYDIEELYSEGYDEESISRTFDDHLNDILAEYNLMRELRDCVNVVSCDDIKYEKHEDGIGWDIYIRMELLRPLNKYLSEDIDTISDELVEKLAKDICNALQMCQKHNVVHRDIKPQNIFVSENGDFKLGDFGIAKTMEKTTGGTKIGTYKFMAPEVYNNQPYGHSADIYSLGLVLYWLLNNRRMPFIASGSSTITTTMEEKSREYRFSGKELPEPDNGNKKLKSIVMKACAYNPKDRYSSAQKMIDALEKSFCNKNDFSSNKSGSSSDKNKNAISSSELIEQAELGDDDAFLEICFRYVVEMVKMRKQVDITNNSLAENSIRNKLKNHLSDLRNEDIYFLTDTVNSDKFGKITIDIDFSWENARIYMLLPIESIDYSFKKTIIDMCIHNSNTFYEQDKKIDAAKSLLGALSYNPYMVEEWVTLGKFYRELGKSARAIHCYEKALSIDPKFGQAYSGMSVAYITLNNALKAKECCEKALPLIDKNCYDYAIALANFAYVEAKSGNVNHAKDLLIEAKKAGYKNWETLRDLISQEKISSKKQSCKKIKKSDLKWRYIVSWVIWISMYAAFVFTAGTIVAIASISSSVLCVLGQYLILSNKNKKAGRTLVLIVPLVIGVPLSFFAGGNPLGAIIVLVIAGLLAW